MEKEISKDEEIKGLHYVLEKAAESLIKELKQVEHYSKWLAETQASHRLRTGRELGKAESASSGAGISLARAQESLRSVEQMVFDCLSRLKELEAF